jgi:hypothetical protein
MAKGLLFVKWSVREIYTSIEEWLVSSYSSTPIPVLVCIRQKNRIWIKHKETVYQEYCCQMNTNRLAEGTKLQSFTHIPSQARPVTVLSGAHGRWKKVRLTWPVQPMAKPNHSQSATFKMFINTLECGEQGLLRHVSTLHADPFPIAMPWEAWQADSSEQ